MGVGYASDLAVLMMQSNMAASAPGKASLLLELQRAGVTFDTAMRTKPASWPAAPPASIALVGNGPIPDGSGPMIDACDWVCRFNEYAKYAGGESARGARVDAHFVQHVSCRVVRAADDVVYCSDVRMPAGWASHEAVIPSRLYIIRPTIGFRVMALCLSTWPGARVHLFGFDGAAHAGGLGAVDSAHEVDNEHRVQDALPRVTRHRAAAPRQAPPE